MKKKAIPPPKPKEFASRPFTAIKGLQPAPSSPPEPPKAAPAAAAEDDTDLFRQAMGDVTPLAGRAGRPKKAGLHTATPTPAPPPQEEEDLRLFRETLAKLRLDVVFRDAADEPDRPSITSAGRLRQLKRGQLRIDYELDLHGLTRDEALESLRRFLASAHQRGQQAVLVITGKGLNSPEEPVLQRAVAAWLRDQGRELVAEFAPAPRSLGGNGAFVVFLKSLNKVRQPKP
jgi:DNA-nicking Smr family endonuclease